MIFWLTIVMFIIIILFIVSLIAIFKYKKVSNFIKKIKLQVETFYIFTSFLTIISIFVGIYAFELERQIQKDNNKIVLENLEKEIDTNLYLISFIEKNKERLQETQEFTVSRLDYFYLEQSRGIIQDKHLRGVIIEAIKYIKDSNSAMDRFSGNLFFPVNKEQLDLYKKLKKEWVGLVIEYNGEIKSRLDDIKNKLNETN